MSDEPSDAAAGENTIAPEGQVADWACDRCGASNEPSIEFCNHCGADGRGANKRPPETKQQMRERNRQLKRERVARRLASTGLRDLGVVVRGDDVYRYSLSADWGGEPGSWLGELTGAHAEVTGGRAGRRRSGGARTADTIIATSMLGPVGLLAGASRPSTQGTAFVVFANGALHEKRISDAASLVRAQADAVRFNALAARSEQSQTKATMPADQPVVETIRELIEKFAGDESALEGATETAGPEASGSSHLADDLERLARLHESGALTDAEFQAAKIRLLGPS